MNDTQASRSQWIHGPEQPGIKEIMYTYPRLMDVDGYIWVWILCNSFGISYFYLFNIFFIIIALDLY